MSLGAEKPKSPDGSTAVAAGGKGSVPTGQGGVQGGAQGGVPAGPGGVQAASSTASQAASSDTAAASYPGVMQRIMALTKDKDVKVVQKATTAAGHICAGHAVRANLNPALAGLFALGFNKNEDVLFTVGEALCFAFGGEAADNPLCFAFGDEVAVNLPRHGLVNNQQTQDNLRHITFNCTPTTGSNICLEYINTWLRLTTNRGMYESTTCMLICWSTHVVDS